jgi:hypothetical protein
MDIKLVELNIEYIKIFNSLYTNTYTKNEGNIEH